MILLMVSIKIINLIRAKGVPDGSRWANILLVLFNQPKIIIVSHKGMANVSVITMCLVAVKIYGKSPIRLLIAKNQKVEIIINVMPWVKVQFNKFLNSLFRVSIKILIILELRFFFTQKVFGIRTRGISKLTQLSAQNEEVEGSKVENRLVIIIILRGLY